MRRDIQINSQIDDIVLSDRNSLSTYTFEWEEETDTHIRGQIIIPSSFDVDKVYTIGVLVNIPYTPTYKPIQLRILRDYGGSTLRAISNPVNHADWYDVYAKLNGANNATQLYASALLAISSDQYIVQLITNEGNAFVWSAQDSDITNVNANIQNRNMMLKCVPSNNYRYPTSGVGLIMYLHGSLSQTNLATRLRTEFKSDKVSVESAAFDSYTGDLDLDLDFSEADADV